MDLNKEHGLNIDTDVAVWLHYRAYSKQPDLQKVQGFVIVTEALHNEFDDFKKKELQPKYSFLEKCDLLDLYLQNNPHLNIQSISRYSRTYYMFGAVDIDDLCQWVYRLRDKFASKGKETFQSAVTEGTVLQSSKVAVHFA